MQISHLLITDKERKLQSLLQKVEEENKKKWECMIGRNGMTQYVNYKFKTLKSSKYKNLNVYEKKKKCNIKIWRCIQIGKAEFQKLNIKKCKNFITKKKVLKCYVIMAIQYGSEYWTDSDITQRWRRVLKQQKCNSTEECWEYHELDMWATTIC